MPGKIENTSVASSSKMSAGQPQRGRKRRGSSASSGTSATAKKPRATLQHVAEAPLPHVTHRCHGKTPGLVLAVGSNEISQLGISEDIPERKRPVVVPGLPENIVQVCAGGTHSACVTQTGQVWTWGNNDEGALGRAADGPHPGKVDLGQAGKPVVMLSAGDSHTAALTCDGRVYAWGVFRDSTGQLGLDGPDVCKEPLEIFRDIPIVKISSGTDHLILLTECGKVFSLGCAEQGQLGRVTGYHTTGRGGRRGLAYVLTAAKVHFKKPSRTNPYSTKIVDVFATAASTFCISEDGHVFGFGLNNYGQMGLPIVNDVLNILLPVSIPTLTGRNWVSISGAQHHTILLDGKGEVHAMGRTDYGRLGVSGLKVQAVHTPVVVCKVTDDLPPADAGGEGQLALNGPQENKMEAPCRKVTAGDNCFCFAIDNQHGVYSWGMGGPWLAHAGDSEEDAVVPTKAVGKQLADKKIVNISAGGQHTLFLGQPLEGAAAASTV